MERLLKSLEIKLNSKIYVTDPANTELGRNLIREGAGLISELGIENFNFKKLSKKVEATEASIYRYFKDKQHLLLYYTSWYWKWVEYNYVFKAAAAKTPEKKLEALITILVNPSIPEQAGDYMNGVDLMNLIRKEGFKVLYYREFSNEHSREYFDSYSNLCERFNDIFEEINPKAKNPHILASLIFSGINSEFYLNENLKHWREKSAKDIVDFFYNLTLNGLK